MTADSSSVSTEPEVRPPAAGADGDSSSSSLLGRRASSSAPGLPPLAKSDSTASAGRFSVASHVSIPVTGALPYGSLRLVRPAAETPPPDAGSHGPPARDEPARPPSPAAACLGRGDVFLLLDLPRGLAVACDALGRSADAPRPGRPLGFRDLPPGPHLVSVAGPDAPSRAGYWFVSASPGRLRVKQWDPFTEVLGDAASRVEVRAQREGLAAAYPGLVPYPRRPDAESPDETAPRRDDEDAAAWRRQTSFVTPALLGRVMGNKAAAEWLVDASATARGDVSLARPPGTLFRAVAGSQLAFLLPHDVLDLRLPSPAGLGSGPAVRDASPDVLAVLSSSSSSSAAAAAEADIVGELQFAFLTGLRLGNPACLRQWWHLVLDVVLGAYALVRTRPRLCRDLLRTLHAQLVYSDRRVAAGSPAGDASPTGILDTIPGNKAKLRDVLTLYKRRLNEILLGLGDAITRDQGAVGDAFVGLEAWFWRYGWDLRTDYVPEKLGFPVEDRRREPPLVVA